MMLYNIGKKQRSNKMKDINNSESNVFAELWFRFRKPWCFSFGWHFFWYIILIGGLGIVLSVIDCIINKKCDWSIEQNIISYSLAMVIPAASTIMKTFSKTNNKVSLIDVCSMLFIVIPIALSILSYVFRNTTCTICCMIIAWIAWIIANYDNVNLNDKSFDEKIKQETNQHGQNWG